MKNMIFLKKKIFKISNNQFTLTDDYLNDYKYNVYYTCNHKIFKSYNSLKEVAEDIKNRVFE